MNPLTLLLCCLAAGGGPWRLDAQSLPAAAQSATGGTYALTATVGDASAAAPASGGAYALQGGLLAVAAPAADAGPVVFGDGFES